MTCLGRCFLNISGEREEHVIQRHFLFENLYDINQWDSFFWGNIISPQQLFHVVQTIPRYQLGESGWSRHNRFVYELSFSIDVGMFPLHAGQKCTTNRVQIVCDCVECPACGIHPPTEIVTIYPGPCRAN